MQAGGKARFIGITGLPVRMLREVAAAFPVVAENQQLREDELERLLQDVIPQSEEELDVPSFLRKQAGNKSRGFFR